MANNTVESAIDKILKDYANVLTKAAKYAAEEARKDIYKYSLTCLEEYYESYSPSRYDRTDYLWHAILPYPSQVRTQGDSIISTVGIEYDASQLAGASYRGSRKYDGRPDEEWILENYLKGIHPATNGSSDPNTVEYYEFIDDASPYDKMQNYLGQVVPKQFYSNLMTYFSRLIK